MRQTIESRQFDALRGVHRLRSQGVSAAVCLVLLPLVCLAARGESFRWFPIKQSGSLSGAGPRGNGPKGSATRAPGYLGILYQPLTNEDVTSMHVQGGNGVEVVMVDHDGPAGKAGLQPHDVIIRLNGQPVTGTECFKKMLHDSGVGTGVSLTVLRGGRQITANAQLAYRGEVEKEAVARMMQAEPPENGDAAVTSEFGEGDSGTVAASGMASRSQRFLAEVLHTTPFTGLVLNSMEPQLAGFFGAPAGVGLLVETVAPNSPAATAGLRAGDVILKADSVEVKSNGAWVRELHLTRGRGIVLLVLRDKQQQHILLIPDVKKHSKVVWPLLLAGHLPILA